MSTENPLFEPSAPGGIVDRMAEKALRLLLSRRERSIVEPITQDPPHEIAQREETLLSLAQLASRQLVVPNENTDILNKSIDQISRETNNQEQLSDLTAAITQPYEQLFVGEASRQPRTYLGEIKHARWSHDFHGPGGVISHIASYYYTKNRKRSVNVKGAQVKLKSAFDDRYNMPTMDLELQDNHITDIELKWSNNHPTALLQNHQHSPFFDFLDKTIPLGQRPHNQISIKVSMASKTPNILVDSPVDAEIKGRYYPLKSSFQYDPEANIFIRYMSNPKAYKEVGKDKLQSLTVSEYGQVMQGLLDLIPNADISRVSLDD